MPKTEYNRWGLGERSKCIRKTEYNLDLPMSREPTLFKRLVNVFEEAKGPQPCADPPDIPVIMSGARRHTSSNWKIIGTGGSNNYDDTVTFTAKLQYSGCGKPLSVLFHCIFVPGMGP